MKPQHNLLLVSAYLWQFGEGMFGPLFAVFSQQVGGGVLDITSAWATFLIVTGICILIFGKISDSTSKERMLVMGYALNASLTFFYLLVNTPIKLLLVQGSLGIAAALTIPTWNALYSKHGDEKKAGFEWSLDGGWGRIINGIGIVFGGFLLVKYSFTTLFLLMGFIQILATLYIMRILWMKKK